MPYLNMSKVILFNEKSVFLIDSKIGNYALGIVKKDASSNEETFLLTMSVGLMTNLNYLRIPILLIN